MVVRAMTQSLKVWQRPLVIGASGQLGVELCRALEDGGSPAVVRGVRTAVPGGLVLDLAETVTPKDAVRALGGEAPDLILCAGAMTFVDGCEDDPEQALRTNTYGPSVLAAFAHSHSIPFVYFSSDYVFPGSAEHPGPYAEDAVPDPLSVYGADQAGRGAGGAAGSPGSPGDPDQLGLRAGCSREELHLLVAAPDAGGSPGACALRSGFYANV